MRGLALTTTELVTYLQSRVARLQRLGLTRAQAIEMIALDDGRIDAAKISALLDRFDQADRAA